MAGLGKLSPIVLACCLVRQSSAACGTSDWLEEYGGEKCWVAGDNIVMSCNSKFTGGQCGMRLRSVRHLGVGVHSVRLKAAPGAGVSTNFYLATYDFFNDRNKPWCEVDFELLGMQSSPLGTRIWTNFLTGKGTEHVKEIHVPFDAAAGFHTYTIDTRNNSLRWLVDGVVYRSEDVRLERDLVDTINQWQFGAFLSLWGRSVNEPTSSPTVFWDRMGVLNWNSNIFPISAQFKSAWNAPVPTALPTTAPTTTVTTQPTTFTTTTSTAQTTTVASTSSASTTTDTITPTTTALPASTAALITTTVNASAAPNTTSSSGATSRSSAPANNLTDLVGTLKLSAADGVAVPERAGVAVQLARRAPSLALLGLAVCGAALLARSSSEAGRGERASFSPIRDDSDGDTEAPLAQGALAQWL